MPGFDWGGIGRRNWLDLALKSSCPLCQRSTAHVLCGDCQRRLQQGQGAVQSFGVAGLPPIFAWGVYGGDLKQAIAAFKYANQPQLAQPLGEWLGEAWLTASANLLACRPVVVPIPLHDTRLQQRGFKQAELLAERFCRVTRLRLDAHGLVRPKATEAQFQLSPTARSQNMAQAFQVHPRLGRCDRPILLVDDIYTTGSTVREAVQTCHRHGLRVSGIVVLAKA